MPIVRSKKLCIWCNTLKDITTFHNDAKVCTKCRNKAAKGVVPTISSTIPVEHKEMTPNEIFFAQLDIAHLARCEKVYYEYINAHPEEFKDGETVTVIDGEFQPRGYPDYETASEATNRLARKRKWAFFVKGHENAVSYSFPSISTTLPFSGRAEDGSQIVYAEAKIKGSAMDEEEEEKLPVKEVKFLVDTGASMCALPVKIVTELGLQPIGRGHVQTGGGTQAFIIVEAQYNVRNMGYIKVKCQTYPLLEHPLLGLNYLTKCRHVWQGTADVQIRLLQPGETPEDSAEIQELINGLNRMDLSTSLVMVRLQQAEVLEGRLMESHQRIEQLTEILREKDYEISELVSALREIQRLDLIREKHERSKSKRK